MRLMVEMKDLDKMKEGIRKLIWIGEKPTSFVLELSRGSTRRSYTRLVMARIGLLYE